MPFAAIVTVFGFTSPSELAARLEVSDRLPDGLLVLAICKEATEDDLSDGASEEFELAYVVPALSVASTTP